MRIKQGRDFSRVRQKGRRMSCGMFIANWQVMPEGSGSRLGVITTKRLGNAVVRGRARRLLREAFRLHQFDMAHPVDMVLVAQNSLVGKGYVAVDEAFMAMLKRAGLLLARTN